MSYLLGMTDSKRSKAIAELERDLEHHTRHKIAFEGQIKLFQIEQDHCSCNGYDWAPDGTHRTVLLARFRSNKEFMPFGVYYHGDAEQVDAFKALVEALP